MEERYFSTLLKVALLHGCLSPFLDCTNGTKSHKTWQLFSFSITLTNLAQIAVATSRPTVTLPNTKHCFLLSSYASFLRENWHRLESFRLSYKYKNQEIKILATLFFKIKIILREPWQCLLKVMSVCFFVNSLKSNTLNIPVWSITRK